MTITAGRKARVALGAASALAAGLLFTGCGISSGPQTASSSDAGAPTPSVDCAVPAANLSAAPADTSKLDGEIRFATQNLKTDFSGFFEPLIAKFESEHPGTKIIWEDTPKADDFDARMVTDAQTCVMADVINVPSTTIMALTQAHLLVDVDNKLPGIGKRFIKGVWADSGLGPGGHHTALPWYWAPSVVTYNKDLMTKAGLDPENPPKTVSELQAQALKAAKSSDGKIKSIWGNTKWNFIDQWLNSGAHVMNGDHTKFTFADDKVVQKWLSNLAEIYAAGGIPADSVTGAPDPGQAYNEGNLIFGSPNASFLRNVKKNAPNLYPVTGVSGTLLDGVDGANFNGQYITVSVTTKNLPLAAAWADYVTNAENQLAWAKDPNVVIFPSAAEALNNDFFTKQDTSDPLSKARAVAAASAKNGVAHVENFIVAGKLQTVILDQIQLAVAGQAKPKDALKAAQDEANRLLSSVN